MRITVSWICVGLISLESIIDCSSPHYGGACYFSSGLQRFWEAYWPVFSWFEGIYGRIGNQQGSCL